MRRNIKNILAAILVLAMLISTSMVAFAANDDLPAPTYGGIAPLGTSGKPTPFGLIDLVPPELTSITFSSQAVTAPGEVTITATATDNLSGVDYASVILESDGGHKRYLNLYKKSDGTLQAKFKTSLESGDQTNNDTYRLISVVVRDNADNSQIYNDGVDANTKVIPNKADLFITVTGAIQDITPPVLTSLTASATSVTLPGAITFTATATDTQTKISDINLHFTKADGSDSFYVDLYNDNGKLSSTYSFLGVESPGNYKLTYVTVYDDMDNNTNYAPAAVANPSYESILTHNIDLEIKGTNQPPEITKITLDKTSTDTPGYITVTAEVANMPKQATTINIHFRNSVNSHSYNVELSNFEVINGTGYELTKVWGYIKVSGYELPGVFDFRYAYISGADYFNENDGNSADIEYRANPTAKQIADGVKQLTVPSFTVINNNDGMKPATKPTPPTKGTITNPGTTDPGTINPPWIILPPGTTDPGTTNPGTTNPGTINPPWVILPGTTNPGAINPPTIILPPLTGDNNSGSSSSSSSGSGGRTYSGTNYSTTSRNSLDRSPYYANIANAATAKAKTTTTTATTATTEGITTATITTAYNNAVKTAASSNVTVRFTNVSSLPKTAVATLKELAAKDSKTATLHVDTLASDKTTVGRMYINPSTYAGGDINPTIDVLSSKKISIQNLFKKWFGYENIEVVILDSSAKGVEVAVKLDLKKFKTDSLKFYVYDQTTGKYFDAQLPNYTIDAKGYLHFTSNSGGVHIITDQPLVKK